MKLTVQRWSQTTVAAVAFIALSSLMGTAGANPIQFNLTATANSDLHGYVTGQSYTFTWMLNSVFTDGGASFFNGTDNYWGDEDVSDAPIFTDVSGDGLTGAWQRPSVNNYDPYSYLEVWNPSGAHRIYLYAGNDSNYSIGLMANGEVVRTIEAEQMEIGNIFSFPGSYTDPNVYFAGLTGTYPVTAGSLNIYTVSAGTMTFTPTSLTISAIPEPSAALLGGLGLTALLLRRRRIRRSAGR